MNLFFVASANSFRFAFIIGDVEHIRVHASVGILYEVKYNALNLGPVQQNFFGRFNKF